MLIGISGLYSQFLTLYELDIRPWRYILSKQTQPGALSQKEDMELIQNLCNPEYQRLLERLKKYILSGPILGTLDPYRRFYTKIDWSKDVMGAVLLQAYVSAKAIKLEAQEKNGVKCEFDKFLEVICLRPNSFITR